MSHHNYTLHVPAFLRMTVGADDQAQAIERANAALSKPVRPALPLVIGGHIVEDIELDTVADRHWTIAEPTGRNGSPVAFRDSLEHDLGGLRVSELADVVRILAQIADNTDPDYWEDLLSREQEQLMTRVSAARTVMDAERPPPLPELTGHALERLLASAGLNPVSRITVGPRHIDLIVETAIDEGLLPAGSFWDISGRHAGCRFLSGRGGEIAVDISELIEAQRGPVRTVEAARHILTVLRIHLDGAANA
jgi:hypothetical protein